MKAPLLKKPAAARARTSDGTPVPGQSWGYAYDAIGNRTASTRGQPGESDTGGVHTTSYAASSLNQYSSVTRPNAVEITGVTFADVPAVKVNGQPATGRPPGNGEPGGFAQWLEGIAGDSLPNGQWPEVTLEFKKPGAGMQGHDLQHTRTGHVYVRPSETPQYDDDGNLIQDAGWTYTWDAENRLIAAEMRDVSVPASVDLRRVEFSYDAKGRRFERRLKVKATPTGSTVRNTAWQEVSHVHYWYDGWNLAAETDDSGSVHQYIWGTDLSGTLQGAGGVGGLLGVATAGRMYAVCTEVNGNVMGLVDGQTGQLVARWDYDPFGNLVTDWYAPGVTSATCPIRFSSKYLDPDLGWYYYGYRYYEPESGRWAGRDPIGIDGGLNLYGMVANDTVNQLDVLGLTISIRVEPANDPDAAAMRQNIVDYLKTICSLCSVEGNNVRMNQGTSQNDSKGCCCIGSLVSSSNHWTIEARKLSAKSPKKKSRHPETYPNDVENGTNGTGTGGVVRTPSEGGDTVWTTPDKSGKRNVAPNWRILGHELCGHAFHFDKGDHAIGTHDQAIQDENDIAAEHPGEPDRNSRGPNNGASEPQPGTPR